MYLTQGLHRAVQRHPDRLALGHVQPEGATAWTFAQVCEQAARRAAALRARGVRPGDRVAILAPNDDALVLLLLACWWSGAVACPLNVRWSAAELRHGVTDCDAALLVADASLAEVAAPLADAVALVSMAQFVAQAQTCAPWPDSRTGGDDLAVILYTGGTTGKSKGVMLTHANLWTACMARGAELNNAPESVSLLAAPLFHVGGLSRMIGQVVVGGGCITLQQFRADVVLEAIARYGISDIFVVPTMLQMMLDAPGFDAARVQSLDRIAFGAAPMPPALLARALAVWPRAEFFQAYGMTETGGAVCINLPGRHLRGGGSGARAHSVGRAGLGAEIRVVDESGAECPRGTVGEIVVRGPMVTPGYWRQPGMTEKTFRDGWLRTGDGGRMDGDGWLYIADRIKDMIISGGENIYPAEVEAALSSHPDVAMVAVIGIPSERWGESVHAVVVPRQGRVADDALFSSALQEWCRARVASYKCPRSFEFRSAIPLSAAGKVLKTRLRADHAQDRAQGAS